MPLASSAFLFYLCFTVKRFFAAILLLTCMVTTTGFVVSTHYCMGRVDGVQLGAVKENTCSKCGMHTDNSGGCCRDEIKVVKLEQEPQQAKAVLPSFGVQPTVSRVPAFFTQPFLNYNRHNGAFDIRPPVPDKTEVHIVHCVFRI